MQTTRRHFLQLLAVSAAASASAAKPLRGIFPIAQSPFTESGELDLDALVEQVKFIDRGRVHGLVWPQIASEWTTLTERERLDGAEAIASAGRKLRPAIVLGVQGPDLATALRYARQAEKLGADAVISLPPAGSADPKALLEYYKAIGSASGLPLFVQAVGSMSVDLILEMYRAVPTLRYVKDEAGQPLQRIRPLRENSSDELKVFSGTHGRTLIEEMRRGFSGSMPAASFADLYAQTWDLWHGGRRREAMDMHARTLLAITEITTHGAEAMKYILYLRGVFKTYGVRGKQQRSIDEAGKQSLRETVEYLKPFFRA